MEPKLRVYKITQSKLFFEGWNRYAFYATITEGPCKNQKGVVKVLKNK